MSAEASPVSGADGGAKRSAEAVAALRFLGSFERDEAVRNPDRLAGRFVGAPVRVLVRVPPLRAAVRAHLRRRFPGAVEYHLVRTRHLDAIVRDALAGGAAQLVVLGAGYDTRAQRLAGDGVRATVFEVEHPATLARKRGLVERAFGAEPRHVRYVATDFDAQRLEDTLPAAGYDPATPAVFVWEGVTMYVDADAIDATLAFVARHAPPGSGIAFDYVAERALERPGDFYGGAEAARHFAKTGEPWRFGLDPERVGEFLAARGLEQRSHLRAADLERAYLRRSDGSLLGRVPDFHGIVHAAVPAR
jgi:methyltransferase (TIGR00027 family)